MRQCNLLLLETGVVAVCLCGYVLPQNPQVTKIDTTFNTPLKPGEYAGLVHLYEQVGDGIPVELHGT